MNVSLIILDFKSGLSASKIAEKHNVTSKHLIFRVLRDNMSKVDYEFYARQNKNRAWNKGLSKVTDERVLKQSQTLNSRLKDGTIDRSVYSNEHTEETKKNLSLKRKKFLEENRDKHNLSLYHNEESLPERNFRELLEKLEINFVQYYIPPESDRFFEIDFAVVEEKIAFEINGNQHYKKDGNLTLYYQERHDYFESLGWIIIEIHYSFCFKEEKMISIINQSNVIK